ncbi:hypothetical protein [Nocardia abscessus]|uniref:hypothetical protein n=1 Tax=Nocardia abscessus TaxID=120957 RepID=UPI00245659B5|nr:hypothetical protein [Nocardia abscessus]
MSSDHSAVEESTPVQLAVVESVAAHMRHNPYGSYGVLRAAGPVGARPPPPHQVTPPHPAPPQNQAPPGRPPAAPYPTTTTSVARSHSRPMFLTPV